MIATAQRRHVELAALLLVGGALGAACSSEAPTAPADAVERIAPVARIPGRGGLLLPRTPGPAGWTSTIPFQRFDDGVGDAELRESRRLVTSRAEYSALFGHGPPSGLDFSKEWVVFYAAGVRSTGGFDASTVEIQRSGDGHGLRVVTRLESPGQHCLVTQALTSPHVLVRFAKPAGVDPKRVQFVAHAEVHDCAVDPPSPCFGKSCGAGRHCEVSQPACAEEPCPRVGACVCDSKATCVTGAAWDESTCQCKGVCADVACPAGQLCEQHGNAVACVPSHCLGAAELDPTTGQCACTTAGTCADGETWNLDPSVCGCVPACAIDADCATFSDYCGSCDCHPVAASATPDATCQGGGDVACFADPCMGHRAACVAGGCVLQ